MIQHPPISVYLGQIPPDPARRRRLRDYTLELLLLLGRAPSAEPTVLLVSFAADAAPADDIDLLLLRPAATLVLALRALPDPIETAHDGSWRSRSGDLIVEAGGRTPLDHIRLQRDAVRARLAAYGAAGDPVIGAIAMMPEIHPESQVTLDIDDHRDGLKLLSLEELPGLAAMTRGKLRRPVELLHEIAGELFGGQLWCDGGQLRFALGPARHMAAISGPGGELLVALDEGETLIGRRKSARRHEHRVVVAGDDLISSDHARLICTGEDAIAVQDISRNGTWVALPDGQEYLLRGETRSVEPGTTLRMGATRVTIRLADRF